MGKWEEVKLKELLDVQNGYAFKSKLFSEVEGIQIIRIRDLKEGISTVSKYKGDYDEKFIVRKGDYLIGMDGEFGCYEWKGDVALLNQRVCRLMNFSKNLLPRFLFYGINKFLKEIEEVTPFVTVKHISARQIRDIEFPLPPIPEQQRIVAKLDGLFAKIDQAIGLLEENIAHTQALMGSVLDGIFDKVYEKHESVPLLKYVDFIGGSQPPKSSFSYELKEGYVRLIQIRDYKSDKHIVYIKEDSTKKFCDEDDVMIGRYGPPVFQILRGLKGAYNVALMKAIPDEEVILKDYLYYFLMNGKIQNYIISISQRSAGQSGVNKKALEAYEIAIPSLKEQQKIVDTIKAAIPKIERAEELTNLNLEKLKALKSSLLDQAFKGEL
ncbi:restriction endonuclease subunit S [Gelidibacter japonicus]|uniref:restriction endonuclease subunit S n=1 Tax=Gelidibacter japonicus TaxID=1962232 RepID=UPI003A95A4DA